MNNILTNIGKVNSERKQINKLASDWKDIMFETNTMNKSKNSLTLKDIKIEVYGYSARVYCPIGLSYEVLKSISPIIEDNLHCIFSHNKERSNSFIDVKITTIF